MKRWVGGTAIFAVAAALYAPTLRYSFTYDDVPIIAGNPLLHSLHNWRQIVASPWWENGLYRPLTSLWLAADWSVGGGQPAVFHLTNLLLHALASVLVYYLALRMLTPMAALAAAMLFAVHPVHVEAVANIVGRGEVLAGLFTVLAVIAYSADGDLASTGETRSPRRRAVTGGTILATIAAFASKESAFALPGLLLMADWLAARQAGEPFSARLRRHAWLWASSVVLLIGWLWMRAEIVGSLAGTYPAPGLEGLGVPGRAIAMMPVAVEYLRLLFFPVRLSADYSPDFLAVSAGLSLRVITGALVLAGGAMVVVAAWRRSPGVVFSLGWMGASLIIVSNVVVPTGNLLAERTLYLASVGACLLLGLASERLFARAPVVAVAAVGVLVLAGAGRSLARSTIWRSNETLFPQLVRDAPGSFRAYWVDGMLHYKAGDRPGGERLIRKGLRVYPLTGSMWRDLGNRLQEDGRWIEAADCFWTAFRINSTSIDDAARAVAADVQGGEIDTAEVRLGAAQRSGESLALKLAASHVAMARGQALRATRLRREVASASPLVWEYWHLTAEAASEARDCPVLLESLDRLTRLNPQLAELPRLRDGAGRIGCRGNADSTVGSSRKHSPPDTLH